MTSFQICSFASLYWKSPGTPDNSGAWIRFSSLEILVFTVQFNQGYFLRTMDYVVSLRGAPRAQSRKMFLRTLPVDVLGNSRTTSASFGTI